MDKVDPPHNTTTSQCCIRLTGVPGYTGYPGTPGTQRPGYPGAYSCSHDDRLAPVKILGATVASALRCNGVEAHSRAARFK
eukprot:2079437-Rhodomonas_salina.1